MKPKLRLQRMERERVARMERAREDFRAFLRRMDHQKRAQFFELVLAQAPGLLPLWDHIESPFTLPPDDPRVVQWLAELAAMQIERDDAADQFLHRLKGQFQRDNLVT